MESYLIQLPSGTSNIIRWKKSSDSDYSDGILPMKHGESFLVSFEYSASSIQNIHSVKIVYPSGEIQNLNATKSGWTNFRYTNSDERIYEYEEGSFQKIRFFITYSTGEEREYYLKVKTVYEEIEENFDLLGCSLENNGNVSYILKDGE